MGLTSLFRSKPKEIGAPLPAASDSVKSVKKDIATTKASTVDTKSIHASSPEEIKYTGDPDSEVLVFDCDETVLFADEIKRDLNDSKVREQVEKDGYTINQTQNGRYYVLRPGTKELLEYLTSRGHKLILSTRNTNSYLKDLIESEPVLKKNITSYIAHDDLITRENQDFKQYPNHPDNLTFWERTKAFFGTIFIRTPKYLWRKFSSVFTGKPVWMDEGPGAVGKYPPNAIDLTVKGGDKKLKGLKPSRFLIDNYAELDSSGKYWGKEFEASKRAGDYAVISPNVSREEGKPPSAFFADGTEPKDKDGKYIWVKNVIEGVERGWKAQYKEVMGAEPKDLATLQ